MKRILLSLAAVAFAAAPNITNAQSSADAALPHRVGLIDMAHVFQNYTKFEDLRTELQAEIDKSQAEANGMMQRLQELQEELKKYTAGSPQYEQGERAILDAKGQLDAFTAATQRKLARRESDMFRTIYTDVSSAVRAYAEHAKFTMVMRFNRKEIEENMNPAEAVNTMNKTVMYHRSENDMTDTVLRFLNDRYKSAAGGTAARSASRPAPRQ